MVLSLTTFYTKLYIGLCTVNIIRHQQWKLQMKVQIHILRNKNNQTNLNGLPASLLLSWNVSAAVTVSFVREIISVCKIYDVYWHG